ncbi:hypothetical protein CYY_004618 [Polysphondylium violaceum]|uniref:vesicle-fusing ATPase n=1 Tax=Polysphondylium violaceum TaxID=133409 RepID=A0A8J4PWM2_9MYCE|nr:hypothetical protein CYY_004618 [Polysphondylium violaceum]
MGDTSQLLRTSYTLIQQATNNDRVGNYQEAIRLYLTALEGFISALKIEKNERVRATLKAKMAEYMDRAEELKELLKKGKISPTNCTDCNNPPMIPSQSRPTPVMIVQPKELVLPCVPSFTPTCEEPPQLPSVPSAPPSSSMFPSAPPPYNPMHSVNEYNNNNNNNTNSNSSKPTLVFSKKVNHGSTGNSFESLFGSHIIGGNHFYIEDPYIRAKHQIDNFIRFCELVIKKCNSMNSKKKIKIDLLTSSDGTAQEEEQKKSFLQIKEDLLQYNIIFSFQFSSTIHDRSISVDNGITIKWGRGLDIYQKSVNTFSIGTHDLDFRPCLDFNIDVFKKNK